MESIIELQHGMFGLLSRPETGPVHATAVVLFNSGIMHRVGPFRLTVRLARALGELGYPTLRFDAPGIGDSLRHADQPMVQITRDVLDQLQVQTGCDHFVVGGICSAADVSWNAALDDERVTGVILLDGMARKRWWFQVGRVARALRTSPLTWPAKMRRRLLPASAAPTAVPAENLRDWPRPGEERGQLQRLIARGTRFFMLFTGGTSYFLHPGQFRETYGTAVDNPAVDFHYWPDCDHMFYAEAGRHRLIAEICGWVSRSFH